MYQYNYGIRYFNKEPQLTFYKNRINIFRIHFVHYLCFNYNK